MKALKLSSVFALAGLLFNSPASGQTDAEDILASVNALAPKQRTEVLIAEARREGVVEWYGSLLVPDASQIIEKFKQRYPFVEV